MQTAAIACTGVSGAGLGLRRALLAELRLLQPGAVDFLECAPENWIGVGGMLGDALQELASRWPLTCHGLSLSLGGAAPLHRPLLTQIRQFLDLYRVNMYSEHLSWCADTGQLYDLLPIPFTDEAVRHVGARISQVQDALGRRIAIENVSYYAAPYQSLSEADFINGVLEEADCDLLLDVNNIFVNAINHGYDARDFIARMPTRRIVCYHVAGHYDEADDLKVDTHGADVKAEVWNLLAHTYQLHGVHPTLLERDFNFPPLETLLAEVDAIRTLQAKARG